MLASKETNKTIRRAIRQGRQQRIIFPASCDGFTAGSRFTGGNRMLIAGHLSRAATQQEFAALCKQKCYGVPTGTHAFAWFVRQDGQGAAILLQHDDEPAWGTVVFARLRGMMSPVQVGCGFRNRDYAEQTIDAEFASIRDNDLAATG